MKLALSAADWALFNHLAELVSERGTAALDIYYLRESVEKLETGIESPGKHGQNCLNSVVKHIYRSICAPRQHRYPG